jgi:uncharacterized protein
MGLGSIDPRRFARERASVSGPVAAGTFGRLADVLCDAPGGQNQRGGQDQRGGQSQQGGPGQQSNMIHYRITGFVTPKEQPGLRIELSGELGLRCQRCLDRLVFPLAVEREIVLVAGTDEFESSADEPESVDIIPAVSRMDLRDLVEEEILLALPLAPRHPAGECEVSAAGLAPGAQADATAFAALARLKH